MSDLPKFVHFHEEGPREGFQIEKTCTQCRNELISSMRSRRPD